ncbi:MAG: alpha/beta-hydrolase N-terminal domain-containing protein [Actinomycetota bacterium]|nr:alpha/beta-hydrolase N-terminal domain-containing protein [Actinomycetota bacterium]
MREPNLLAMESSRTRRSFGSFVLAPPAAFGVIGGGVFWWLSLAPTLLPLEWMIQAAISALSIAVGYGVGSAVGAGVRWIAERFE